MNLWILTMKIENLIKLKIKIYLIKLMSNAEETNITNTKLNNKSSDFNKTKGGKLR